MVNKVLISDSIEKAIIMSFDKADSGILPRKAIIELVKQKTNEKEPNIVKRIEKMSKNKYLIKVDRGLYSSCTEIEFELGGESLPSEEESQEIPAEMRRKHTFDLKEAIKVWKGSVPKPTCENDLGEVLEDIKTSEIHIIFPDLHNHLALISDICTKWKDYKEELKKWGGHEESFIGSN